MLEKLLPFYKCMLCSSLHWKKKNTYEVIITNDDGVLFNKYICDPCGDVVNERYQSGLEIQETEPEWNFENSEGDEHGDL